MRNLVWICCCFLWESLPTLTAYPLNSDTLSKTDNSYWELYYTIGLLGITATAFTLVGCLCCRRNRPKGFQDNEEEKKQEFKNGTEGLPNSFHGLELEVAPPVTFNDCIQFEPLPVERIINNETSPKTKPPLSPSLFEKDPESDDTITNQEWQSATDIHVPREKLKYVREVGHGWFGKVVEGCIDLSNLKRNLRSDNVVVRILTEEATAKEKAWFLGEATPYFKLRHRNILSLLGSCLEADPYLLLFEACPPGDLKGFLRANNDLRSRETLIKENMPTRIAIEVAAGLRHMHEHGFAHTDLSARNCLVAADLSIKLGDYGIGVEKYPEDYYVLADRALPIRWSAPESLICTQTTIETREITYKANIWSYAILLWEIATWGERPYDDLEDEKVIEMLLSTGTKNEMESVSLLMKRLEKNENVKSMLPAIKAALVLAPEERPDLAQLRHMLLKDKLDAEDFEQRWESLKPARITHVRSASLQDLRGSFDSECWSSIIDDRVGQQPSFRLGPEEPIKNVPEVKVMTNFQLSDSETEEESWRGRIERGAYSEKVKQKSKSVADLMVLVYIDPDSDADMSLGPQINDKPTKKRLNVSGSDSDLHSAVLEDNFDQALKKLREPAHSNIDINTDIKSAFESLEKLNNQLDPLIKSTLLFQTTSGVDYPQPEVARVNEEETQMQTEAELQCFSNDFNEKEDISLWNSALDCALQSKTSGFLQAEMSASKRDGDETGYNSSDTVQLTPSSLDEDKKRVNTPDDERSSDSGFRDKESCEDDESPLPRVPPTTSDVNLSSAQSDDEEQLRILLELDTILDAEYTGTPTDSLEYANLTSCFVTATSSGNERELKLLSSEKVKDWKNEANILDVCDKSETWPSSCTETTQIEASLTDNEDNEDNDSSTVSLKSDNSYISFNMDEEFVTAIRNELREKLPHAQMLVVEPLEPRDEDEPSSIASDADTKSWADEESEAGEQSGGVDIAIRYNIYGAQLSPILEERESALNSESLISKDDSKEDSVGSALEEDMLVIDRRTNQARLLENYKQRRNKDDGNDTSDDEDDDEDENNGNSEFELCSGETCGNAVESRARLRIGGSGAPLPSPEEESKWQKISCAFPLPAQMQDDCMMSTSFTSERDWDNQNEAEEDEEEEEEEDNSSSSGEFVWKKYDDETRLDLIDMDTSNEERVVSTVEEVDEDAEEPDKHENLNEEVNYPEDQEVDEDLDEEEEEEFTPSAWDATLAPHRSALRSPDKTLKSGDQKKSVWFKKQNYHCVYEYPKEVTTINNQEPSATTWEPTSYADWEEMMEETRLDLYPMDYDDSNNSSNEFYVTSSNRPFQFQSGDKFTSQFFPGASSKAEETTDESSSSQNKSEDVTDSATKSSSTQQNQLGELRHTRDRLKLNLISSNGAGSKLFSRQNSNDAFLQSVSDKMNNQTEAKDEESEETQETENNEEDKEKTKEEKEDNAQQKTSPMKLSPSEKGNTIVDYNENCGFLKHG